jgi:4-amino-4-deoxy-L-arabinose transferase-like glycosyltransferase
MTENNNIPKSITKNGFSYEKAFWVLITGMFLFRMIYILISPLQLSPEEAYYWSYSRHPALGYFDHPPMVAWIIWIFTSIFGHTEFGIRIGAVLLGAGLTFITYRLAKELFDEKTGFFSALLLNLAFVFSLLYSTAITPDSPLFFFWGLAVYAFMKGFRDEGNRWWYIAGAASGCALLSKYTAILLLPSFAAVMIWEKADRRKWMKFITASIVAFLVFSPVIIWNLTNDMASFKFQSSERAGSGLALNLVEFAGSIGFQAAFVTPFIFFAMIYVLAKTSFMKNKPFSYRFLLGTTLPTILFFYGIALVTWVKTNWPTPAYITGLVLLGACFVSGLEKLQQSSKSRFNAAAGYMAFAGIAALLLNGLVLVQPFYPKVLPGLSKANTAAGWKELTTRTKEARELLPTPNNSFITGHGYQIASALSFYGFRDENVYSSNVFGERALAYDFWQDVKPLKGMDAVVVTGEFENFHYPDALDEYFEEWKELDPLVVEIEGVTVRTFRIFVCLGYRGS